MHVCCAFVRLLNKRIRHVKDNEQHRFNDTDMTSDTSINDTRTLTKAELAEMLFDRVGLNKREAKDIVDTFFEEIRDSLARGESVKLSGFGNFQVRNKPPRPGRNPKTGETIPIAARRVVTFHASQKLKGAVEHPNQNQI